MLEIQQTVTEIKNALMSLSADWTQPKKISVSLQIGQEKLLKGKCKEKNECKKEKGKEQQNNQELLGNFKSIPYVYWNTRRKRKREWSRRNI